MSDTFAFRSLPVPLRSRVNLRAVKTIMVVFVVVAAVSAFARWTIGSEQRSLAAAARHAASISKAPVADSASVAGAPASGIVAISVTDVQAQAVARHTLGTAERLVRAGSSLMAAGPGQLAGGSDGVTYTDGPSIAPTIVSVASTHAAWGVAVMSQSGLCFGVRLDAHGAARYGTLSSGCTGADALQVTGVSW